MRDLASPLTGILSPFGRQGGWNPRALFRASDLGFWYDPSDITTMFSDTAGTTQVVEGDPIARIIDKSGVGLNATQTTVSQRPLYVVASNGDKLIQNDEIDDALTVTLPDMGTAATYAYVKQSEVFFYDSQTIGAGAYTLPATDILGMVMIDRALTTVEKIKLIVYLAGKASGVNYGAAMSAMQTACLNAVDVFVYDTSKDSDGGLWRTGALAQATSWYNETLNTATRGSRREFPAVAVIVAEATKVTIYDGEDPSLPMWMIFTQTGGTIPHFWRVTRDAKCVAARDGKLLCGVYLGEPDASSGLLMADFVSDQLSRRGGNLYGYQLIGDRLSGAKLSIVPEAQGIAHSGVNDVAMAVLPNAPIDPATGLPVPTIAVATAGGLSVIDDAGPVYDSAKTTSCTDLAFDQDGKLRATFSDASSLVYDQTTIAADGFTGTTLNTTTNPAILGTATSSAYDALGSSAGMTLLFAGNAGSCRVAKDYNTGWMPGNIKGAFLASTDTASLVGSGELVTNGTFDTDTSGWTAGSGAVLSVVSNKMRVENGSTNNGYATQAISTVAGKTYVVTFDFTKSSVDSYFRIANTAGGFGVADAGTLAASGSYSFTFVAAQSTSYITLTFSSNAVGFYAEYDNISVKLADADRSVNAKGLVVNGTVTRSHVATGAELVAYSGFSSSNYLQGTSAIYVDTLYSLGWVQIGGVWQFKHGVVSAAPIDGLTIAANVLKIEGTLPKALIRLTATTPSAEQLAKIEADEKALFQSSAQCTIYGTSNAVTALAHDPDTGLLHVGTSAGRSVFRGLERISNTTTSVATAISAAGGFVAEK